MDCSDSGGRSAAVRTCVVRGVLPGIGLGALRRGPPMKAFPYLRVSGKAQVDGDGPERQHGKICQFCHTHRLELQNPIFEAGVSGTVDGLDRPELAALFNRMEPGDCLVVERMDRLARDLMVQEFFLAKCREKGLKVFTADGELQDVASNEGDPTRVLIRQILGAVAQWEKSVLVAKMKAGADRKRRETGRCGGVVPYGEMPGEGRLLKEMIVQHEEGLSLTAIAEHLNQLNFKTRSGKIWTKKRVHNAIARHTRVRL